MLNHISHLRNLFDLPYIGTINRKIELLLLTIFPRSFNLCQECSCCYIGFAPNFSIFILCGTHFNKMLVHYQYPGKRIFFPIFKSFIFLTNRKIICSRSSDLYFKILWMFSIRLNINKIIFVAVFYVTCLDIIKKLHKLPQFHIKYSIILLFYF